MELLFPPIEIELDDEILIHPDSVELIPPFVRDIWAANGTPLKPFIYIPRGYIFGTGKGAEVVKQMKFHLEIQKAMAENVDFLELVRRSGLS